MMLVWILYSLAISVAFAAAAWLLDRAGRAIRWPIRGVWIMAIALSAAWPFVARAWVTDRSADGVAGLTAPSATVATAAPTTSIAAVPSGEAAPTPSRARELVGRLATAAAPLDTPLRWCWVAMSVLVLLRLVRDGLRLRHLSRRWRAETLDGTRVLVSADQGPAVVGVRQPRIVIPAWVLEADADTRSLILRHEDAHRSARDSLLLFGARIAVAIAPWNASLWWQSRRLRLAIEMDCDGRVLSSDAPLDRYAEILLATAERRAMRPIAAAAALTESPSDLERRIDHMSRTAPRFPRAIAVVLALAALAAAAPSMMGAPPEIAPSPASEALATDVGPAPAATAKAPSADGLASVATRASAAAPRGGAGSTTTIRPAAQQERIYADSEVDVPAKLAPGNRPPTYPMELRVARIEGSVDVEFVLDAEGHARMNTVRIIRSTDTLFTAAVLLHLPTLRYIPATKGGRAVAQRMHQPFVFGLAGLLSPSDSADAQRRANARNQPIAVVAAPARSAAAPFFDFQVERQAKRVDTTVPEYPSVLGNANLQGRVVAQFVVDTLGIPDTASFKIILSTHALFSESVHKILPLLRYTPALVGNRPVKQLVQQEFVLKPF